MKTYTFAIETGYVGSLVEEEIEVEDYLNDDDLHAMWVEWVWQNVDGGYSEVEQ